MELYQILYAVHTGTMPKIPRSMKNKVNAILADQINVGDIVRVIATGKIGRVNRKIPYDRTSQEFFSPYGYTAIQVDIDGRLRNYAARSLLRIDAQPFEGQDNVRTM